MVIWPHWVVHNSGILGHSAILVMFSCHVWFYVVYSQASNPVSTSKFILCPTLIMRIVSWNVKGLRFPNKRSMVLRHLKRPMTDIALLQETHLEERDFFQLQCLWVGKIYGSSACHNKAGVITLIHKNLVCDISHHQQTTKGGDLKLRYRYPIKAWPSIKNMPNCGK